MKAFLLTLNFLFIFAAFSQNKNIDSMIDTSTVRNVDIKRYMGKWYEIARYPHSFEKGLTGVTATYKLLSNGRIEVTNSGYKNTLDGKLKTAKGKAKIPDQNDPAKLKVSFFLFFYGDYYILELDPDYQWVLIGSSSDKYLWILSRTPSLDPVIYNSLLENAKNRGYDINKLIKVPQKEI